MNYHVLLRMGLVFLAGLAGILWGVYVGVSQFYLMRQMANDPDDEKFASYGYKDKLILRVYV